MLCGTDKEKAGRPFKWKGLPNGRRAPVHLPTRQP